MSNQYRDDREALRQRCEQLTRENEELRQHLAAWQSAVQERDAEIARLKALIPPPPAAPQQDGTVRCNACGKDNESHYKFCLGCGAGL